MEQLFHTLLTTLDQIETQLAAEHLGCAPDEIDQTVANKIDELHLKRGAIVDIGATRGYIENAYKALFGKELASVNNN